MLLVQTRSNELFSTADLCCKLRYKVFRFVRTTVDCSETICPIISIDSIDSYNSVTGCIDDIRLNGYYLPLPPAVNGTQWGQATMARNLARDCPSTNSCVSAVCQDPLKCVDLWNDYECS